MDSHARPISASHSAPPESEERPAITPAPATRLSSRPPPLPASLPLSARDSAPAIENLPINGEDDEEELTPVSVTKPSLPFDHASVGLIPPMPPPVVALAGHNVEVFDALLSPLPPPALIVEPPAGYRAAPYAAGYAAPYAASYTEETPSSGPVSSAPISGPVSSIAPPMPQIPKQISSSRPPIQAPGIVSTQAIPLIVPAKKQGQSPLFVMFAAALIGGMIALAVALSMRGRPRGDAEAAPATPPADPVSTSIAVIAPAPPAAPSSTSVAEIAPAPSSPSVTVTAPSAKPTSSASSTSPAPIAPIGRPARKSDRIED